MNGFGPPWLTFFWMLGLAACATATGPLAILPTLSQKAAQENLEGITRYNQRKWAEAKRYFESTIESDPTLPEGHFNLALTLHRLGKHKEAKQHFEVAGKLAPKNKDIVGSAVYRDHLGLSSTFKRHISGGYRY